MRTTAHHILAHHRASLEGTLHERSLPSDALGLNKPYFVYEPPDLGFGRRLPLLYLFRGHEREWVNLREDHSREKTTALEDLDRRIVQGDLPPMIVVMPGITSDDNHVPSLGIDMVGPLPPERTGLGTGRFWQFLVHDLLPAVEASYPEARGGRRLVAGFSLGGFTASLLALHNPGYFDHVGIYDGLFMWPGHRDPRLPAAGDWTDRVWCTAPILDPALGIPRDPGAMRRWNTTDTLLHADESLLHTLRRTTFWIASASADGHRGNLDRARYWVRLLRERGLHVGFDQVVFHFEAAHTWHWTDRFLLRFLDRALVSRASREAP